MRAKSPPPRLLAERSTCDASVAGEPGRLPEAAGDSSFTTAAASGATVFMVILGAGPRLEPPTEAATTLPSAEDDAATLPPLGPALEEAED
mmetsp:Transcript_44189/g.102045  ORF Transcript_44189/g.102045 Transcript_44189/m.102045 type:complete len:91 (+) Transcript_44189:1638-1910(+)